MTRIRVDPPSLTQASEELASLAERLEALSREITEVADSAPSYDGQFGPKVRSLAAEGESQLGAISDHADALSTMLQVKAEEFAAADLQSESAFAGLQQSLRDWLQQAAALGPLAQFASLIGLDNLTARPAGEDEEDGEPPWWAPALVWLADGMNRAVIGAKGIAGIADITMDRAWEGGKNLLGLFAITQYMLAKGEAAPAEYLRDYILLTQGPGFPNDGPITPALLKLLGTKPDGKPISPVGADVARLFENREVQVSFIGSGGAAPWAGRIAVGERYIEVAHMERPFGTGLVAHELTHLLERDIDDPYFFPDGKFRLSEPRRGVVGDSTNYMEVLSYIVGETVEYDFLVEKSTSTPLSGFEIRTLRDIENDLATYTQTDGYSATLYVVKDHNEVDVYKDNFVLEAGLSDHRIPDGGWDHWLLEMGFSDEAITHIRAIAGQGAPVAIDPSEFDPNTGELLPPPSVTPTTTPTTTPSPTPTPTSSPTPTPTPTSTPTPTQTASSANQGAEGAGPSED